MLRQFRKSPGFTLAVVATLALTVALSTTVFSVLDAVFLRPLPYNHPERIFALRTISTQGYTQPASYPEFLDWRRDAAPQINVAGYSGISSEINAELNGAAVALHAVSTTDNFFDVLGVKPRLGRTFEPGEEDSARGFVAVLSYEVWHDLFAARTDAIGEKIKLDGRPYTVIGVMPQGFRFPVDRTDAIYFPLHLTKNQRDARGNHWLWTIARTGAGVTRTQAQSRLEQIFAHLAEIYPGTKGRRVQCIDLATNILGNSAPALRLLLYGVVALIAIGCVNLAGLLLARGVRMEQEIAIRSALGAGRARLVARLLSENLAQAIAGGLLGILLADLLIETTRLLLASALNRGAEVELNGTVLAVSLTVSILTSVLAGLWPALRLSTASAANSLRAGNRGGMDRGQHRLRAAFVCVQVSLALVLLITSGLVFRELARLQQADFGFDPSHILTAEVDLSPGTYEKTDVFTSFFHPMLERAASIPGVRAAGLIQVLPIQNWGWNSDIQIVGQPPAPPNQERLAEYRMVTSGYFPAFGVRLLRGRFLDEKIDTPNSQRVMVVNQRFVDRFIPPALDPIGQAILDGDDKVVIVGVVSNIRQSVFQPALAEMDMPLYQIPPNLRNQYISSMQLVLATANAPQTIIPDLRRLFGDLDRTLPFRAPQSMDEVVASALTFERLENWAFGSFAALALMLALIGLYGLISHEVELARRDMGIRIALGASRGRMFRLVYSRVGAMLAIGVAGGVLATFAARKLIATVVPLHSGRDAETITALIAIFAAVSLAAAFLPAHRAATVDPMASLRAE
jgi:putative ABC transport system permease protein